MLHFSLDDVWFTFHDLTVNQNRYRTIFDNPLLRFLRYIHGKYGTCFFLYVFGEIKEYKLSAVTDRFHNEFEANSEWLKFGFHALRPDEEEITEKDYEKAVKVIYETLEKAVGKRAVCSVIRLHGFKAEPWQLAILKDRGVEGVLCADDDRKSYDLSGEENAAVKNNGRYHKNRLDYIRSDFRLEKVRNIKGRLKNMKTHERITVFSHERYFYGRGKLLYYNKLIILAREALKYEKMDS